MASSSARQPYTGRAFGVSETAGRPHSAAESAGLQDTGQSRERIPVRIAGPHTRRDSVSGITVRQLYRPVIHRVRARRGG